MKFLRFLGAVIGIIMVVVLGLGGWVFSQSVPLPAGGSLPQQSHIVAGYEAEAAAADEIAATLYDDYSLPGLSVAVAYNGELVWTDVRGFADLQSGEAVTQDSRFLVGSVAKTLTAVAALQLAETGELDLDVDVRTYVPEFPEKAHPVTARQLLSHQGGIRHYQPAFNLQAPYLLSESGSARRFADVNASLSAFSASPLLFEPGTGFQYSTYGYTLLSAAIEGASGQDFLGLMDDRIFGPAGMAFTGADFDSPVPAGRVTDYLVVLGENRVLTAPEASRSVKWAGGGFLSTPTDLVRFGSALLDGELVSAASLVELTTPRVLPDGSTPQNYAAGLRVAELPLRSGSEQSFLVLHHGGTSIGSQAALVIVPEMQIVVALAANGFIGGSEPLLQAAVDILRAFDRGDSEQSR